MGLVQNVRTYMVLLGLLAGHIAASLNGTKPTTYGIVLFRAFDPTDVYGPTEILWHLGGMHKINITFIANTLDPVTTEPLSPAMNPFNSTVYPWIQPTHTFETAPVPDVLIIPGGPGMRAPEMNSTLKYIAETVPKVKHLITICTGSGLAARAGVLDGKNATTNKSSWPGIIGFGPKTTWIPKARWVEDESGEPPIWSSSGVTAGYDLMFHFVETFYGSDNATLITTRIEHVRTKDKDNDPFARNETIVFPVES